MKKGLISIAVSAAVLSGGLLGAAPANAAAPNYDAKIKSIESQIQVEGWKIFNSRINHATKADSNAYNHFINASVTKQKAYTNECVARGVEQFYFTVKKTQQSKKLSVTAQKQYNIMAEKSYNDAKQGFKKSADLFKTSKVYFANSHKEQNKGKSFKYKRTGMERFFKDFSSTKADCSDQIRSGIQIYTMWGSSKNTTAGNSLTAADKATLNKSIDSLKKQTATYLKDEKTYKAISAKEAVKYDANIKAKITKLQKDLAAAKNAKNKASQVKK